MIRLLLVLAILVALFVLVGMWLASSRHGIDPAVAVVRRVRELAWDHRDIEPTLAQELIERISEVEARGAVTERTLDELLEMAWRRRETDTGLSVAVVDLIRSERRALGD